MAIASAKSPELVQRASELLRLVAQGETIEITDRGRAVARLAPVSAGTPLEQLRAAGEIDAATADRLEAALLDVVSTASSISVDLAAVNFMDSSGLRAMIIAMNAAREAGVSLRIVATTPAVDRLLEITGLTEHLT